MSVSIVDGGDCLADLNVRCLNSRPVWRGRVLADPWRVIDTITPVRLARLLEARRQARKLAWANRGRR